MALLVGSQIFCNKQQYFLCIGNQRAVEDDATGLELKDDGTDHMSSHLYGAGLGLQLFAVGELAPHVLGAVEGESSLSCDLVDPLSFHKEHEMCIEANILTEASALAWHRVKIKAISAFRKTQTDSDSSAFFHVLLLSFLKAIYIRKYRPFYNFKTIYL